MTKHVDRRLVRAKTTHMDRIVSILSRDALPNELVSLVVRWLEADPKIDGVLLQLGAVNKRMRAVVDDESTTANNLWRKLCLAIFPECAAFTNVKSYKFLLAQRRHYDAKIAQKEPWSNSTLPVQLVLMLSWNGGANPARAVSLPAPPNGVISLPPLQLPDDILRTVTLNVFADMGEADEVELNTALLHIFKDCRVSLYALSENGKLVGVLREAPMVPHWWYGEGSPHDQDCAIFFSEKHTTAGLGGRPIPRCTAAEDDNGVLNVAALFGCGDGDPFSLANRSSPPTFDVPTALKLACDTVKMRLGWFWGEGGADEGMPQQWDDGSSPRHNISWTDVVKETQGTLEETLPYIRDWVAPYN